MAKKQTDTMCPICYLQDGISEPLQMHLGQTKPITCGRDHVFQDREELSTLVRQMLDQKRALAPKADVPPPVLDEPLPPPDEENAAGQSTNPISLNGEKSLTISAVDMVRLTSLVGKFRDGSTLFGMVFALSQELKDTKELLKRAQDSAKVAKGKGQISAPRALQGEEAVTLIIPERHVQPIKDIANANGMDIERYLNAKVEDGLDNMWFY